MKKNASLLLLLILLSGCNNPVSRSWIIPVSIDPSDLLYTPAQMESFPIRRNQVLSSMDEGFVILRSIDHRSHNRHEFRPNNYFYYLTGCAAPYTYAILNKQSGHTFTLSLPRHSIRTLIYEGGHLSAEEVKELFGPDRLLKYDDFQVLLDSILKTGDPVYIDRSDQAFFRELERMAGKEGATEFRSVTELVDEMRVIKEAMEVERLQKACNITARALTNVMKECSPGQYEFEMESVIEGTFRTFGAAMPGFPSIVGSGPNSTILHYELNNREMENGELLLMDIGAEYGYYTADITRTIPVNGRFNKEQQTIYQLVLNAQLAAIEQMIPGNMFMDGHMAARDVIVDGLEKLGLMTDSKSPWQIKFYILYPSSHYLGLDVHDVGEMGESFSYFMQHTPDESMESRVMEPGMVLTIEPGLYFRENGLEQLFEIFENEADSTEIAAFIEQVAPVYEKYINIGVRIEDDILITKKGNINLSRYAPKEIRDIEQIMRR
ncbi:MAG: aminopeptidase P family protein [Bacteroidales bacterium]|nr:aminopeptidase P family protein [Bacteroidales bacterium]